MYFEYRVQRIHTSSVVQEHRRRQNGAELARGIATSLGLLVGSSFQNTRIQNMLQVTIVRAGARFGEISCRMRDGTISLAYDFCNVFFAIALLFSALFFKSVFTWLGLDFRPGEPVIIF